MPLFKEKWEVSDDLLEDVRSRFLEEVESSPEECAKYHPDDVKRVRENDWYIARYILHQERDVDLALKMLKESLKYRNDMDINTIGKEDLPADYFASRCVQLYNKDHKDHPIVVIRGRMHIKNADTRRLQQQYMLYWVEKGVRANDWGAVSILFDCTGTSYKNVDTDMIRFILNTFKQCYPWGLGYFIVYNVPWYLSAFWKLFKQWIPEKYVGIVVFVDKHSIREYINEDQLPLSMGGTCPYSYEPKDVGDDESSSENLGWL